MLVSQTTSSMKMGKKKTALNFGTEMEKDSSGMTLPAVLKRILFARQFREMELNSLAIFTTKNLFHDVYFHSNTSID